MAGPGRATSGRPTLQTSSNQRNSHRLARTPVTNVVNLSQKTTIFSQKADGLTTFVTTDQKSTRKTPRIDDVCNNTHRATHQQPGAAGEEGAGGSGGHGRASRSTTPSRRLACGDLAGGRARRRPEHQRSRKQQAQSRIPAAVPVGGGGAWPDNEVTRPATHQRHSTTGVKGAGGHGGHGRASRRGTERSEGA